MKFIFNVIASNDKELSQAISTALELYFPSDKWNYTIETVNQNTDYVVEETDSKKGKKKQKPVWEVTVEVYPAGLQNSVVKICGYST